MSTKYSILMSVYYKENPEWLKMSIESMLKQTIAPDEFLIVKDGPLTSALDAVIDEYVSSKPEIFTIIKIEKNGGLGPALALGITKCRNDVVIRMDSDDYSVPYRCERLLEFCNNNPEYGIVGSYEVEFEGSLSNIFSIHKVPEKASEIYHFMKRRCALLHPTVLYKKSVIIQCGNYHDVRLYEDYDLFMRVVLEHKVKCYNIPENLYYIRINKQFFERRGGIKYLKTVVSFKWRQYKKEYMSFMDFFISAGSQAIVCLLPNKLRTVVYMKLLRR